MLCMHGIFATSSTLMSSAMCAAGHGGGPGDTDGGRGGAGGAAGGAANVEDKFQRAPEARGRADAVRLMLAEPQMPSCLKLSANLSNIELELYYQYRQVALTDEVCNVEACI